MSPMTSAPESGSAPCRPRMRKSPVSSSSSGCNDYVRDGQQAKVAPIHTPSTYYGITSNTKTRSGKWRITRQ
eukprot:scaffold54324_cov37-Prasinocladus_malaysianus.AAC.4